MDCADSSAAGRALADAATATGRAQQQMPKRIRREGRALNNVISIVEEDVQGQRGRINLIRDHPCETNDKLRWSRLPPLQLGCAISRAFASNLRNSFGAFAHDRAEARVGVHEQSSSRRVVDEPRDATF